MNLIVRVRSRLENKSAAEVREEESKSIGGKERQPVDDVNSSNGSELKVEEEGVF